MTTRGCQLLLPCLLAGWTAGCLLFTDAINNAPSVAITVQQDGQDANSLVRSKTAYFTAQASDPDQSTDSLQFDWYQGKTCDKALAGSPVPNAGHVPFPFQPADLGTGCVAVVVTDNRGATATATLKYEVVDQAPVADIKILPAAGQTDPVDGQTYPLALYSELTLSGADSSDPDDVQPTPIWHVYSADDTEISLPGCPDNSKGPYVCTFSTETPGAYRVKLVVNDNIKTSTAEQVIQVAEDQLPSIDINSAQPLPPTSPNQPPRLLSANLDNSFTINRVVDDGDPYPSSDSLHPSPVSPAGFVWYFRYDQPGAHFDRWIGDSPIFTIPAGAFLPEESIQVRVEYHDRVTACQPMTADCDAVIQACDPNATICYSIDHRAQWVTWTVVFR